MRKYIFILLLFCLIFPTSGWAAGTLTACEAGNGDGLCWCDDSENTDCDPDDDGDDSAYWTGYATFAALEAAQVLAGDDVIDGGGNTFRETWTPATGGTSGHQITIQNAVIYGSTEMDGFEAEGQANTWDIACTTQPTSVWFNESGTITWGVEESAKADVNAKYDWYWSANVLYVYSTTDPDSAFTSIEASTRDSCVELSGKNYITIQNIELAFANVQGLKFSSGSNWIIQDLVVHHNGESVAEAGDGILLNTTDNSIVRRNKSYENGRHNIYLFCGDSGSSDDNIIEENEVYNSYHANLDVMALSGRTCTLNRTIVRYNKIYNTSGFTGLSNGLHFEGIEAYPQTDTKVYGNVIHDMTLYGVNMTGYMSGFLFYNNIIYNTQREGANGGGMLTENVPTQMTIRNNISMNNDFTNWWLPNSTNITMDNNCTYGATHLYRVNETNYDTLLALQTALSWETSGIAEDPLFTSATDLTLQSSSPAIGAGADLGNGLLYGLDPTSTWPDNVKAIDQDDYGDWEIGAYVKTEAAELGGPGTMVGGGSGSIPGGGSGSIIGTAP